MSEAVPIEPAAGDLFTTKDNEDLCVEEVIASLVGQKIFIVRAEDGDTYNIEYDGENWLEVE